jgi:hypothetical protein
MKSYYVDVTTTERRKLRVSVTAERMPTAKQMHERLKVEDYDDITDEETLKILSVDNVKLLDESEVELGEDE